MSSLVILAASVFEISSGNTNQQTMYGHINTADCPTYATTMGNYSLLNVGQAAFLEHGFREINRPPNSPDLATCDYFPFTLAL